MKSGERSRAVSTRSPSRRAASESSGSCRLFFASADWWPEVTLPSTHSARSMICRHCATCCLVRTWGICSIMTSSPCFAPAGRSEEHTSELQSRENLVCRLLLEKKKKQQHFRDNAPSAQSHFECPFND